MADEDDPVVASYDVILTGPPSTDLHSGTTRADDSQLFVLQYPAHRSSSRPYSASRQQKPASLKYKKKTGVLEIEVPIVTSEHYNQDTGSRYGAAVADSRTVRAGGSHGLAGGFNSGPAQVGSLQDVPSHQSAAFARPTLATQTLGGKIAKQSEREPIYFLGALRNDALHLSHLDAVVQMRPQLHHIDAEDENNQRRLQLSGAAANKPKPGIEVAPKLESKAIEIKLKDSKEDPRDRSLNASSKLLRDIQVDAWQRHEWVDQENEAAQSRAENLLYTTEQTEGGPGLKSVLSNGDWLDRMSAPREDGKKGLLAKLRGRERERARRKKAEEEKRLKSRDLASTADPNKGPLLEQSSDSDLSSPEASDMEQDMDNDATMHDTAHTAVVIKEEPAHPETAPAQSPTRKRGRPKKAQPGTTKDSNS